METTGCQGKEEFMFIKKNIIIVNTYWLIPVVRRDLES